MFGRLFIVQSPAKYKLCLFFMSINVVWVAFGDLIIKKSRVLVVLGIFSVMNYVFDIKKDLIQSLIELGLERDEMLIEDISPSYYHPGISGSLYSKDSKFLFGYFGQLHPKLTNNT